MKKKKKSQNQFMQWIVTSGVLFGYFLVVLISYSKEMQQAAQTQVENELAQATEYIALDYEKNFSNVEQAAQTAADIISHQQIVTSSDAVEYLKEAVEGSPASYGYVSTLKGDAVDSNGVEKNVWLDEDFAKALSGTKYISDIEYIDEDEAYETKCLIPILDDHGIKGVLCLFYRADQFEKLVSTSDYDGLTMYALMRSDGVLVNVAGNQKVEAGNNLYEIMIDNPGVLPGTASRKLKQNLDNLKSGAQFCTIRGKQKYVCYRIIGETGWYACEFFSQEYFNRLQTKYYRLTKSVILKMLVALAIFFGLVILINVLSKAINNRKNEELQSKAETDLLTGLLNKMATEKHIQEYIDGDGHDVPGMLCVLDIDNFKKINDTMGHAFGDTVLSTLGIRLRNQFRVSDIIGRIGGDEFIVYLKNISDDATRKREAERLVRFFKDFQAGDYVKYSASASIGVAMYPQDGMSFEELYKAADKGVYLSKQRGKAQLAFYEETKNIKIDDTKKED